MTAAAVEAAEVEHAPAPATSSDRRRSVVLRCAAVGLLAIGLVALVTRPDGGPVGEAMKILEDDASFATAVEAGAAFTRVSTVLQQGGEECAASVETDACDHLFVASAHARVSAVSLLSCTKRDLAEGRQAMTAYLARLAEDRAATVPPIPSCEP